MSVSTRRGSTQHKSPYVIEKGLRQSLESTDLGLKQFLLSIQKSGMVEALAGYRALQTVLVQQRLWAHANGRGQLKPLFRSIAKTAGELHRIFNGYGELMRSLKDLDKLTSAGVADEHEGATASPEAEQPEATALPEAEQHEATASPEVEKHEAMTSSEAEQQEATASPEAEQHEAAASPETPREGLGQSSL
jgi:hypothetical protein